MEAVMILLFLLSWIAFALLAANTTRHEARKREPGESIVEFYLKNSSFTEKGRSRRNVSLIFFTVALILAYAS